VLQFARMIVWFLFFVSLGAVAAGVILLIILGVFGWGNRFVLYWLSYSILNTNSEFLVGMSVYLFLGSIFAFLLIAHPSQKLRMAQITRRAFYLGIFASLLFCGMDSLRFFLPGFYSHREHLETIVVNDHLYHLQSFFPNASERYSQYYDLYECDRLDLFCSRIYSLWSNGIEYTVESIHLIKEGDTVSIEINGDDIVYTHDPFAQ
jgi:hypothetical protein